jgi:hypothetical protein
MSEFASFMWLAATIWIGWPLHQMATDFRALRKLAEKSK